VEAIGSTKLIPHRVPRPSDIYTINFTSGTTGNPKVFLLSLLFLYCTVLILQQGVVLTHANAATAAMAPLTVLMQHSTFKEEWILSFLPLAHIYERGNVLSHFVKGVSIGIYHGVITEVRISLEAV
jgi:long-chain acyl-CoA synthetase